MKTKQALVTVGGNGNRLRSHGVKFSLSKSFINFNGKPLLYYCLTNLHKAGITDIVIIGNKNSQLKAAKKVISNLPFVFPFIIFYKDKGLGTCGLPYHAKSFLNNDFFFEFGHNVVLPSHYRKMDKLKLKNSIVSSIFRTKNYTKRPFIRVSKNAIISLTKLTGKNDYAIAAPYLLDKSYINLSPILKFNSYKLIQYYLKKNRLFIVKANFPIEIDVIQDLQKFFSFFNENPKNLSTKKSYHYHDQLSYPF